VYAESRHAGLSYYFFQQWTANLAVLEQHFASLKHLTLSISDDDYDRHIETYSRRHLTRLIRAAPNVETLYLDIDGDDPACMLLGDTSKVGRQPRLDPKLEKHFLNLASVTFTWVVL